MSTLKFLRVHDCYLEYVSLPESYPIVPHIDPMGQPAAFDNISPDPIPNDTTMVLLPVAAGYRVIKPETVLYYDEGNSPQVICTLWVEEDAESPDPRLAMLRYWINLECVNAWPVPYTVQVKKGTGDTDAVLGKVVMDSTIPPYVTGLK